MSNTLKYALAGLAALLAGAAVLALWPSEEPPAPLPAAPEPQQSSGMDIEAELDVLLGTIERIGRGETHNGVRVANEGAGVVFAFASGRKVSVMPSDGVALDPRFVVPNAYSGGFILRPENGRAFYVNFADGQRRMEPAGAEAATALYRDAAERIAAEARLPFLDGFAEVVSSASGPRGVYYCLQREAGLRLDGATRFVGPLAMTVMQVGFCQNDTARLDRLLDLGEAALAGNR
ncbi:MAG: hypothetical protein AAGI34_05410 [Pseudomonadota bacterium]